MGSQDVFTGSRNVSTRGGDGSGVAEMFPPVAEMFPLVAELFPLVAEMFPPVAERVSGRQICFHGW